MVNLVYRINHRFANSLAGRYFCMSGPSGRVTKLTTEVRSGLTTFLAMAYIIAVNAAIISESGGPCKCNMSDCSLDTNYLDCQVQFRRELVTSTSIVSGFSSLLMGLFANLPIAMSCGLGASAYFVYSVVGVNGSGTISYSTALGAIFLEGILFIILTLLGVRQWLARLLPKNLRHSTGVGIGLFLAFIGFRQSSGIGLIGPDPATLIALAGCKISNQNPITHQCERGIMQSPTMWIGLLGLILITVFSMARLRGGMLLGILIVAGLSWIPNTPFTFFPDTIEGNDRFSYFSQVIGYQPMKLSLGVLEFDLGDPQVWIALCTFLYVDLLDATGTIYSLVNLSGLVDENSGDFPGATRAYLTDALCISIGACFGVSPITAFMESGVGIAEGGITGITSIVAGLLFLLSTFFAPIFASIPSWSTGPALILVGSLMIKGTKNINWDHPADALPAFLTIILMPLTFSIAYGILAGLLSHVLLLVIGKILEKGSRGRLHLLPKYEKEESVASLMPPWIPKLRNFVNSRKSN